MKIAQIDLPEYSIATEPDADKIGSIVDAEIKKRFMGRSIVVRGIASSEHPDKSANELIKIITRTGTDRYNPDRKGDRYENIENKNIDLFGVWAQVSDDSEIFKVIVWGFYHSAKAVHGHPVRIDVVIIYDAEQLEQVTHQYEGRDDVKDDGFAFRSTANKAEAVLGVFRLL